MDKDFLTEKTVINFYLELVENNKISFLRNIDKNQKNEIIDLLKQLSLTAHEDINKRILLSKELWKLLFIYAMSYIDPNKRGFDKLFSYLENYLEFEELIFAADSFYRDHTIHLLLSYFLGEYLFRKEEFQIFFKDFNKNFKEINNLIMLLKKTNQNHIFDDMIKRFEQTTKILDLDDAIKCVMFLTHDLGYPLSKIEKISKSMNKILPYYGVKNQLPPIVTMDPTQQLFIQKFLESLSFYLVYSSSDFQIINEYSVKVVNFIMKMEEALRKAEKEEFDKKDILELTRMLDSFDEISLLMLREIFDFKAKIIRDSNQFLRYARDFENYKHGIMSAYLLTRTVDSLKVGLRYSDPSYLSLGKEKIPSFFSKLYILKAMSDHTSDGYKIRGISDYSQFLLLVDEIEEFSRMSRANQYRQFINEFCRTRVYTSEDYYLTIEFIFDNQEIRSLDPERAFKDKAYKFAQIFDITNLSENLKIRFIVRNELRWLPNKPKEMMLEIESNKFKIIIDGEKKDPVSYLGSADIETF